MKRWVNGMMWLAVLGIAATSCMDREAVKQKIRSATETVKAAKGITDSGTPAEAEGPKHSSAREKAMDEDNPWYADDFRMELDFTLGGGKGNDLLQHSGNVFYQRRIASNRQLESLTIKEGDKWVTYLINPKTKQAQRQKEHEGTFAEVFRRAYAKEMGLVFSESKQKEKKKNGIVMQETEEEMSVSEERMNGFDCEVTTVVVRTKTQANPAMKALDGILGGELSKGLEEISKKAGNTTQTGKMWIDKKTGAVVKRTFQLEGADPGLAQFSEQAQIQFTVKSLVFNPDPNLVPRSLEGYTLVN